MEHAMSCIIDHDQLGFDAIQIIWRHCYCVVLKSSPFCGTLLRIPNPVQRTSGDVCNYVWGPILTWARSHSWPRLVMPQRASPLRDLHVWEWMQTLDLVYAVTIRIWVPRLLPSTEGERNWLSRRWCSISSSTLIDWYLLSAGHRLVE